MRFVSFLEVMVCWFAWWYPFIFRAPHVQKRESITLATPTRVGLALESVGICIAFLFRTPDPGIVRVVLAMLVAPVAPVMAWSAVKHLGRQFRINAGLYHDHQLVHTGAYAVVRHPIYSSLLAILVSTLLLLTDWRWAIVSLVLYIAGTEIRVRTEDGLLASRFGEQFEQYRRTVPAYIPWLR
ncbi:MAG TPA: isoprenylcysteine carboxylmethyltransferase family protein [Candidatus Sulfopaludibacter sp.]|nr:isoprenylcysteine carboxylmethyltransferase family protein [Candidatus Sulfopaludibacter sp.]